MLWERNRRSFVIVGSDFVTKLYVEATYGAGRGLHLGGDNGADLVWYQNRVVKF
jgi:hypothetical protein